MGGRGREGGGEREGGARAKPGNQLVIYNYTHKDMWQLIQTVQGITSVTWKTYPKTAVAVCATDLYMGICQKKCHFGFSKSSKFKRVVLLMSFAFMYNSSQYCHMKSHLNK